MKTQFTIILSLFCLVCLGQATSIDTIQSVELRYFASTQQLSINFENNLKATIAIYFDKYPSLKSISIFKYSSDNKSTLIGFKGSKVQHLSFAYSDFKAFASHNDLPENIIRFNLWKYPLTTTDTLFLPKELEKWTGLKYISIGCCGTISLDRVDLTKFKKLDTLILEGPIYEVNSLAKLKNLPYLGLWTDDWETDKFKRQLDTLLPDTKKEPWCFPPNQQVLLFNGQTKAIQYILKGDTLLSYDFDKRCFTPSVVLEIVEHNESNYPLCSIISTANSLIASIEKLCWERSSSVTATVNHPIFSYSGNKISIGNISEGEFICYVKDKSIEKIQVGGKHLYSERTKVYNLITEQKNYFVNGYLFSDK